MENSSRDVLRYIEKLKEVNVEGVEPTAHAFPLVNVTRPDEIRPSLAQKEACAMRPPRPMASLWFRR